MDEDMIINMETMDLTISLSHKNGKLASFLPTLNVDQLLNTIYNIDIGESFNNLDYQSLNADFFNKYCQEFNMIQESHKHMNYKQEFRQKRVLKKNYFFKYKGKRLFSIATMKCTDQAHIVQVLAGIRKICFKMVPIELTGSWKNRMKIEKFMKSFLKTAYYEPFNLLNLVESLDMKSIAWIQTIHSENLKFILIAKFIKWLFLVLVAVVRKVFHVSHIRGETIFIFHRDWKNQKEKYVDSKCQKSVLQKIGPVTEVTESSFQGRLIFISKRDELRPITMFNYTVEEKKLLQQTKSVLKYLYDINYPKDENIFYKNFFNILKMYKRKKSEIFIVSCDIRDAYGSIVHGKMYDIVYTMFLHLDANLIFKPIVKRQIERYELVTDPLSYDSRKCEIVGKDRILEFTKKFIFETEILFRNNIYNVNRGIAQGLIISAILCKLYYTAMKKKYFRCFENNGHLFQHVDDYLFLTNQRGSARKFLDTIHKGIPEFNCHFKESKHNLDDQNPQQINYLGWKLDSQSLEVEPTYKNSGKHAVYYGGLNKESLERKITNLTSLKMKKLILSKDINSSKKILQNVALISRRQAERFFALSNCLYSKQPKFIQDFIITKNRLLIGTIERLTEWGNDEKQEHRRELRFNFWKSFYNVSRKYKKFSYLMRTFKTIMSKYTCRRKKTRT